jgi:CO/xanthine dehydrogenase FAD-binding subunit
VYRQPVELAEALETLSGAPVAVLAGGTDFYPARVGLAVDGPVLDISRIAGLRGIESGPQGWRIGALTTWSEVAAARLPAELRALAQAAVEVGGRQIQNRGTVGGNLCNASPAADGVPALLALGASVELASRRGRRLLPLERFVTGNRRTALAPDELLTAVLLPARSGAARSGFLKLGHRRYLVISIAMAAAMVDFDADDRVAAVGIAVGACSAAAVRLPALEAGLCGVRRARAGSQAAALLAADPVAMLAPLAPIDDVRGTAAYRLDAASTLVGRLLAEVAG